jgi:hypothetical protein
VTSPRLILRSLLAVSFILAGSVRIYSNCGTFPKAVGGSCWSCSVFGPETRGHIPLAAAYGKHKMAPRLSPKKSWEGYAASVFTGMITGAFYVYVFQTFGNLDK